MSSNHYPPGTPHFNLLLTLDGAKHKVRIPSGGTRSLQFRIVKVILPIDNFDSFVEFDVSIAHQQ